MEEAQAIEENDNTPYSLTKESKVQYFTLRIPKVRKTLLHNKHGLRLLFDESQGKSYIKIKIGMEKEPGGSNILIPILEKGSVKEYLPSQWAFTYFEYTEAEEEKVEIKLNLLENSDDSEINLIIGLELDGDIPSKGVMTIQFESKVNNDAMFGVLIALCFLSFFIIVYFLGQVIYGKSKICYSF